MSELTTIYLNFTGSIPEMDNVRECDWWIKLYGDRVTEDMLLDLQNYITKVAKRVIDEDEWIDYDDMCIDAEAFMMKKYGYKRYDSSEENNRTIEVRL